MRQLFRELFTSIGGPNATAARLRVAAVLRFVIVVPAIFVPTLIAALASPRRGHHAGAERVVHAVWLAQAAVYVVANAVILLSRGRRPRLERALTYLCAVLELGTNHTVMYSLGTLANHGLVFDVVAVAIYRVFFDFRLGLVATLCATALFAGTGVLEAGGLLPVAPGSPFPLRHLAYVDRTMTAAIIQASGAALLLGFAAVNYGMNQVLKLHRYITESVLRRYLPPSLVARAAEGALKLDAAPERRVVTVMFVDLVGFTALSERLGADAIGDLLNRYLSRMADIAHRHGATIDKFVGDAMMVVFGAPEPLPPVAQARQCVALALELQDAVPTLQPDLALQVRAGINTGEAVVGNFGTLARSDYTVVGPTVNIAARLETASRPGRILVGPETARLLGDAVPLEPAGDLQLKGVSAPVAACYVAAPPPAAAAAG
ncbi:MAG TPA: adenylate/guanylate cyclase domain-containing protein [Polyangia bacterium]|jgi:class 3 adenylate cyclase